MDYERAWQHALHRLNHDLPDNLYYHSVPHTRDVVVPATERLADYYEVRDPDRTLLLTAAWYHDLGFIEQFEKNEPIGARIAAETLPDFGYSPEQIAVVQDIIMATQIPHQPKNLLHEIIADADMDALGRVDFMLSAEQLRMEERDWRNRTYTDEEWFLFEMRFLSSHRYFTRAQRRFRNRGKVQNYLQLAKLLVKVRHNTNSTGSHSGEDTQPFQAG
jgi:uncharacterized protein